MIHLLNPERHDVLNGGVAPKHIRKFLRDVGGITPWGENRYRLVLADCVMLHCGARWHDWAPGTAIEDQGGLEMTTDDEASVEQAGVKKHAPVRIVEEMRWIRRYPHDKGWMLQAWYPSSYYSPEHYEITVAGRPDLPLLGEFPAHGQYERQFAYILKGMRCETFPTMPGESWMERAIQFHEKRMTERGAAGLDVDSAEYKWRMIKTLDEMAQAREAYEKSKQAEFEAKIRDKMSPLYSNTLEAGRIREQWADSARAKGVILPHVGN